MIAFKELFKTTKIKQHNGSLEFHSHIDPHYLIEIFNFLFPTKYISKIRDFFHFSPTIFLFHFSATIFVQNQLYNSYIYKSAAIKFIFQRNEGN